jgi:hypothetical protein
VGPDGSVDQNGDTRTSGCRERDATGRCKTTFYAPIFNALARWAALSGDSRYERLAYLVWLRNWASQPGDTLPAPGLWVSPNQAGHGEWLTVWGTRFQPLETVRIYLGTQLIQTVRCDQIGSFGGHSPQPNAHSPLSAMSPGVYQVVARGSLGTVRITRVTVTG